jgi:hypothetical protein
MKRITYALVLVTTVLLSTACGSINQMGSAISGQPTEYHYPNGVSCYYSQSGSLSCVKVR